MAAMHCMLTLMSLAIWKKNGNGLRNDVGAVAGEVRDIIGKTLVTFWISDTRVASCGLIAPMMACTFSLPMNSNAAVYV